MFNLTIAKKLYAGFATITFMMIIISIIMWVKADQISNISKEIKNDDVPGAVLYLQVLDEFGDM